MNINLSKGEQFLCHVLRHKDSRDCEKISDIYMKLGNDVTFELCVKNRIESIAASALIQCLGKENLGSNWIKANDDMNRRISSYMQELDRISGLLETHGIPLVALKNSGITRGIYPDYAECPMGDIDVMVRKSDFVKAHTILIESGYTFKYRSPLEKETIEEAIQSGGAEYSVDLPDGQHLWFELQWRPVAGRWIRPDQEPTSQELMDRSIALENTKARLLSPLDNLLQVSLHTAKHTYVRAPGFRLHTDVDRIVRSCQINWSEFIDKVVSLRLKTAVFFSLALAKELLKTPVPDEVLNKLRPGKLKYKLMRAWLLKVGLFEPDSPKWGRLGYVIFVSMLYDSIGELLKGVFPEPAWMREHYRVKHNVYLPYYYILRIVDLAFKRVFSK